MGLLPDGDKAAKSFEMQEIGAPAEPEQEDTSFKEVLRVPIFWSVAVSGASFGIMWAGFNYHAADIMLTLANMTPT